MSNLHCQYPNSANQIVTCQRRVRFRDFVICRLFADPFEQFRNTSYQAHLWFIAKHPPGLRNVCKTMSNVSLSILADKLWFDSLAKSVCQELCNLFDRD